MRTRLLWLLLLSACATTNPEPAAPPPATKPEPAPAPAPAPKPVVRAPKAPVPIADYFKIRRYRTVASFSADEQLVAFLSDEGGRMDIWVQPVSGGPSRQLTHVQGFVENFEFSPTKDVLVFAADVGGDEMMRLYFTDSTGKAPEAVFPDEPKTSRLDFVDWAADGKTFVYKSSRRDPGHQDLYEFDVATKKSTLLWEASGKLDCWLVSRDHKLFAIGEMNSDADFNIHLAKRGAKGLTLLTAHEGTVMNQPAAFSPDGKTLYYVTDKGGEFAALHALDLASKKSTPVLEPKWDVDGAGFSEAGKYFFTQVNADGAYEVQLSEAKTKKPVPLPATTAPGPLVPVAFSKSDRWLASRLQTDVGPITLWVTDLKEGKAHAVGDPLPESLKGRGFVAGQSVRIKSFDGREVPAFLYQPEGPGPFPALLDIHGGPTAQSMREFRVFAQYLATKGYVVLVPNVRGSTGYGKTYTRLDNKDLGGGPLKDVLACKQWLVDNAKVDGKRVAIMGGSYGGYMTLAAATFAPTEFAAHVDIFGVSDLKTLVESFPAYWAAASSFIYAKFGDPKDPADATYQHDRSPIHFIEKIQRPLMVVQGTNDARVKKDQSDRVVEALRKRNVPVDYLVIDGEGHGFSKTENLQLALETADRFLDKHLFGDTEVKVLP